MKFPAALGAFLFSGLSIGNALAVPTADEIISRVKAQSSQSASAKQHFAYQRMSRVDYIDENGEVKRKSVRVYEVAPVNGEPVTKLVEVNGRPPTPKEESTRSAARETGDKSRDLILGEDLLSRYDYTLVAEDEVGGRKSWVLEFQPKAELREDAFIDKLLNAIHGRMWVDQEDYALSKVDVHLGKKVSFFGGLAGAIERLDLQLMQKRVDTEAWLTEALALDFSGRKLFSPMHLRCLEKSSGFRKISPLAGK